MSHALVKISITKSELKRVYADGGNIDISSADVGITDISYERSEAQGDLPVNDVMLEILHNIIERKTENENEQ